MKTVGYFHLAKIVARYSGKVPIALIFLYVINDCNLHVQLQISCTLTLILKNILKGLSSIEIDEPDPDLLA